MKKILLSLALLASSVVSANQNVQVTGSGYDLNSAKEDALQRALMKACKSAVVSDQEFRNRSTARTKVVVYNGCLVKNFTVDDETSVGNIVKVTITAEVTPNHLPDRIINKHQDWFFYDFNQHKDRVAQLKMRMANARSLIDEVFLDYPTSAFSLERSDYFINYEEDAGYINVSFKIFWNKNFVRALEDTFDILKDQKGSIWNDDMPSVQIKRNYVFNSFKITEQVHLLLSNNGPNIRVRVIDTDGREVVNTCYNLRNKINLYDLNTVNKVIINANGSDKGRLQIKIPENTPDHSELQMDVVPQSFCKSFI